MTVDEKDKVGVMHAMCIGILRILHLVIIIGETMRGECC